jgi:Glycosyl transferases group 1
VARPDIVCLSHLRWNFVFQRPNHLMSRAAREGRVFFVEEPLEIEPGGRRPPATASGYLDTRVLDGVTVVTPRLVPGLSPEETESELRRLLDELIATRAIDEPILWYYTPMALPWSRHVRARAIVYDCMDELSAFRGAPPELLARERELLLRADVVFTGGHRLHAAKRTLASSCHAFPSGVDLAHFGRSGSSAHEPADQRAIPHPRLGYFGVIDERLDLALIDGVAELRPDWHLVLVGPVAKLADDELPMRPNIHYLGLRGYDELPDYLSGWDVAIMPFARNAATEFISPTKTPEYLAGHKPVVSTSVPDVVATYGSRGWVRIADSAGEFVAAAEAAAADRSADWAAIDAHLAASTWDATWARMAAILDAELDSRRPASSRHSAGTAIRAVSSIRSLGATSMRSRPGS